MNRQSETSSPLDMLDPPPGPPTNAELEALRRLIQIAQRDTGQSRRVADFLLAWWNAGSCGGFDLTTLWGVDRTIADDMTIVFGLIARIHQYPPHLDPAFDAEFRAIAEAWRSDRDD
jgi:hypothetical protein